MSELGTGKAVHIWQWCKLKSCPTFQRNIREACEVLKAMIVLVHLWLNNVSVDCQDEMYYFKKTRCNLQILWYMLIPSVHFPDNVKWIHSHSKQQWRILSFEIEFSPQFSGYCILGQGNDGIISHPHLSKHDTCSYKWILLAARHKKNCSNSMRINHFSHYHA